MNDNLKLSHSKKKVSLCILGLLGHILVPKNGLQYQHLFFFEVPNYANFRAEFRNW
jgi:hypothetical protein